MAARQNRRLWLGGGGVVAVLISAIAWFLLIGPEFSATDDLRAQAAGTLDQNTQLQRDVAELKAKSAKADEYAASLRRALESLPYDSGLPAFTRQVAAQAGANHVAIDSISVGAVTSKTASAPADASTGSSDSTEAASSTDSTQTAPAPLPGAAAGGIYSVQITLVSTGPLANQTAFLKAVHTNGPRRALVTTITMTPGAESRTGSIDGSVSMTTQISVYSAPQTPDQVRALAKLLRGELSG